MTISTKPIKAEFVVVDPITPEIPQSKADLDSLAAGANIRVTFRRPFRDWGAYEGKVDGNYSIIRQNTENPQQIDSTRVPEGQLEFDTSVQERRYGMVLEGKKLEEVAYLPGHERYETAKQMLIQQDKWRGA